MSSVDATTSAESKQEGPQLVNVSPQTLSFTNATSTVDLHVSNITTDKRIIFRVQTTAPTRYVIVPSGGFLKPSEVQDVSIQLQADRYHPRHLFILQAMEADETEVDRRKPWKTVIGTPRPIQTIKLIADAEGTTTTDEHGTTDSADSLNSSPAAQHEKLALQSATDRLSIEKQALQNDLYQKEREWAQTLQEEQRLRRELQLQLDTMTRENARLGKLVKDMKNLANS